MTLARNVGPTRIHDDRLMGTGSRQSTILIERLVASLADRSDVIATIARLLPGTNAGSLATSILPAGFAVNAPGMNSLVAGPVAAAVLGVYVMAAGALTCAVIARRDVR